MSRQADNSYYDDDGFQKINLVEPSTASMLDECLTVTVRACEQLRDNNFAVIDSLIDTDEASRLREEVAAYYSDGKMSDGEIGASRSGSVGGVRPSMRTDKVVWLEGNEAFVGPCMKRHIKRMDILSQKIAIFFDAVAPSLSWAGMCRTKVMATVYPGNGARYVPHYDNPNENGRRLTCILYLNPQWQKCHGGILRMKTNKKIVDVAPLFNRLLLFWSDKRCPHEVLPATGPDRYAITIWYMDQIERDIAEGRRQPAEAGGSASRSPPATSPSSTLAAQTAAADA